MNASIPDRRRGPWHRATRRCAVPTPIEAFEPRLLFTNFVVTTTADSGAGSLRQSIIDANANPADDDITFNIPGSSVRVINVLSPLPTITDNVTMDATGWPAYADNGHKPVVEINGANAGAGAYGLRIASTDPLASSTVLGLIINGFSGNGVEITGDANYVAECYIGTDPTGAAAGPGNGGHGVFITSHNNFVTECTLAFNRGAGIAVAAGSFGNTLAPNAFFSNGGLGIDLGNDGVTLNDPGDADNGPNRLQNSPLISARPATAPATGVTITGTINTTPNTLIEITLYSSPGIGNDIEGRVPVTVLPPFQTDSAGNGSFTATIAASTSDTFTATATSYSFTATSSETNTSEISPAQIEPPVGFSAAYVRGSTWAGNDNNASTLTFKEYLQAQGLGDTTWGYRVYDSSRNPALNPNDILPWVNIDEIVLHYDSAPVGGGIPSPGNVVLDGVRSDYTVASVTQLDPQTFVLHLDRPLGNDTAGGENGDRIRLHTPVGPDLTLNVLQGDVDKNGSVLANDFSAVKARFFKSTN